VHFQAFLNNFWANTISGLAQGAIYALFALGYTLVYGVLRLINFAHSEVFMLGTFGAILTWRLFGLDQDSATPAFGMVVVYLLAGLLGAMLFSAVTATVVERVAYRPLRKRNAPVLAFLISAIGASVVLSEFVGVLSRRKPVGVPPLVRAERVFSIGGAEHSLDLGQVITSSRHAVQIDDVQMTKAVSPPGNSDTDGVRDADHFLII